MYSRAAQLCLGSGPLCLVCSPSHLKRRLCSADLPPSDSLKGTRRLWGSFSAWTRFPLLLAPMGSSFPFSELGRPKWVLRPCQCEPVSCSLALELTQVLGCRGEPGPRSVTAWSVSRDGRCLTPRSSHACASRWQVLRWKVPECRRSRSGGPRSTRCIRSSGKKPGRQAAAGRVAGSLRGRIRVRAPQHPDSSSGRGAIRGLAVWVPRSPGATVKRRRALPEVAIER